jgi:hypothetical protein
MIIDQSGNIYLSGMFLDTIYFGSKDNYMVPLDSVDSFIMKLNPDGSEDWIKEISGSGYTYVTDIAVDEDGFIYFIGDFGYSMRIDDVPVEGFSGSDSYLCKLDPEGNLVEPPRKPGNDELLYFFQIELDKDGNILITGMTEGKQVFGIPFQPHNDGLVGFMVKLDSSYNAEWMISLSDNPDIYYTGRCYYTDLIPDEYGNIYITGYVDADPEYHITLSKVDPEGELLRNDLYETLRSTRIDDVFLDKYGDVYMIAHGIIYFPGDTVSGEAIVAKIDSEGEYLWSIGLESKLWTSVVDQNGYTIGIYYKQQFIYDGLIIIDPQGEIIYNQPFDNVVFQQLTMDVNGNVYCNGVFKNNISLEGEELNPESGTNYLIAQLKSDEMINGLFTESIKRDNNFKLYPTPSYNSITIKSDSSGPHTVEIISISGQLLYSTRMEETTLQIDLSSFQEGIYLITIRSRDHVKTEKIIKL